MRKIEGKKHFEHLPNIPSKKIFQEFLKGFRKIKLQGLLKHFVNDFLRNSSRDQFINFYEDSFRKFSTICFQNCTSDMTKTVPGIGSNNLQDLK